MSDCLDDFKRISKFTDCCQMTDSCAKSVKDTEKCFSKCLSDCVVDTAIDYAICVDEENGSKGCDSSECVAVFEEDLLSKNTFKDLEDDFDKIADDENCDQFEDNTKGVCKSTERCCKKCSKDFEGILSCIINDVLNPLIEDEYGVSTIECDVECKRRRVLMPWEEDSVLEEKDENEAEIVVAADVVEIVRVLQDTNATGMNATDAADSNVTDITVEDIEDIVLTGVNATYSDCQSLMAVIMAKGAFSKAVEGCVVNTTADIVTNGTEIPTGGSSSVARFGIGWGVVSGITTASMLYLAAFVY